MIRVAIIEDESKTAELLKKNFNKFGEDQQIVFEVTIFDNATSFLAEYHGNFDLVTMDIDMPQMNGIEAAERLRKIDNEVILVFVTNMAQYAIKGYQVNALDFMVKPVVYSDFVFKMKRVLSALQKRQHSVITIKVPGGIRRVSGNQILYVEVSGHKIFYHLIDETITVRGSLSKVENQLQVFNFLRCNSCYLVNPSHIKEISGYVVRIGGEELQISHPRKQAFLQELSHWISNGGSVRNG